MQASCNTCKFMCFESQTKSPEGVIKEFTGTCHRYPPVLVIHKDYEEAFMPHVWLHPIIDLMKGMEDWCGEYSSITT